MAKKGKYKSIKLEQDELNPITIGRFESRKKSSFGIFIIMSIFILVVIFLPEISSKVDEYLNPPVTPNPGSVTPKPTIPTGEEDDDDEEDYADTFYNFATDLKIERKDILVDSFILDQNNKTLSFKVTNNSNTSLNLNELNYYLELYNKEQTLIERVKVTGDTVSSKTTLNFTKNITEDASLNMALLVLVKKQASDYPSVVIGSGDGNGTLACSRVGEELTYKFKENGLEETTSVVSFKNTEENYLEKYTTHKELATKYNSKTGVTSTFIDLPDGYTITTTVNLKEASRINIFNADSFDFGTNPSVVKFEMEAQNFTCK